MNWCLFGFHKYSKFTGLIDARNSDFTKLQARVCEDCGKIQVKKISQPWNTWFLLSDTNTKLEELQCKN
jgi:hypothetical protein